MRRTGWLVALALAAIGCASPQGSATVPTLAPPVLDPAGFGVTCGDDLTFHPALLAQAGRAETDADPAADALRAWLAGPEGAEFARSGWIRVAETPAKVQFLAPDAGGGWQVLGFFVNQGAWTLDLAGSCTPHIKLPNGVNRASLRLDPAFPAPTATDRQVHLLINETACASGQSPEGRVLPPFVTATPEGVWIAVLVTSRPGGQDCPGNPEFPVTVDLADPLGDRPLFDPTVFPAAPIGDFGATPAIGDTDVDCGPVAPLRCAALARDIVERTELKYGVGVLWVRITDDQGSHRLGLPGGLEIAEGVD